MILVRNYKLELVPNLKSFTFDCVETITLKIKNKSKLIKLDMVNLNIHECKLYCENKLTNIKIKINNDKLMIMPMVFIHGKIKLIINYSGHINNNLTGFYRSQYAVSKNKTEFIATTQLEPTYAKMLFPCYDEPHMKSTFDINILVDENLVALSNMPLQSKTKQNKRYLYRFQTTPPMSTYLLYIGVGKFEFVTDYVNNTMIRIVTTRKNQLECEFALKLAKKFLVYYENYFGINFQLPKLDLIAIPDFAAGAMENWGAITFREAYLLYDKQKSTVKTKQLIAEVISHELAHQWFGNLVTMKWWNDLWLNESFATFLAIKSIQNFFPRWHYWDQFLEQSMNSSMQLDSLYSTHPIDTNVKKPTEINEIFDEISYEKGCCILRMLEHYIGEQNMRMCLKNYITSNIYQNATGDEFWDSIDNTLQKQIKKIMKIWITQKGFPILEIKNIDNESILIQQQRFLPNKKDRHDNTLWNIPITIGIKEKHRYLLTNKTKQIKLDNLFPIVNTSRSTFLRINYKVQLLTKFIPFIKSRKLPYIDRWSIQNDCFTFCIYNRIGIKKYLELLDAYVNENDYLCLMDILNNLNFLYLLTVKTSFEKIIKKYLLNYFDNTYKKFDWNKNKNNLYILLRNAMFIALGKLGKTTITEKAKIKFKRYKKTKNLDPDLCEVVFTLVAWVGDINTYHDLIKLYNDAVTEEEKLVILTALCNFKDDKLLIKTLDFSLTPHVRSQNMHLLVINMVNNQYGRELIWPWIKDNWNAIISKVGLHNLILNKIVSNLSKLNDLQILQDIDSFFKNQKTDYGITMTLKQTLEAIKINHNFMTTLKI